MIGKDVFKIWAPFNARWTDWVRPVPFVLMNDLSMKKILTNFTIPKINYLDVFLENTAFFIDLPGYDSITEGIALAKLGYRPIPLFNGTDEQDGVMALVDNKKIEAALLWGTSELKKIKLAATAPPTFLIDSNRMHRFKMSISVFDNSWDLYEQDIPTAEYFLKNNINKIVIRSEKVQKDLARIFYNFQKKGITFLFTNGYDFPQKIILKKPPRKQK